MKIAIIGAGRIGSRLCTKWADAGHEVILGVRDNTDAKVAALIANGGGKVTTETVKVAATMADVVVIAVGSKQVRAVMETIGWLPNQLFVETVNAAFDGAERTDKVINELTGSERIVKAFNTVGAEVLDNTVFDGITADTFLCGNRKDDKMLVTQLAHDIGYEQVYDIGGIDKAPMLEQVALFWASLAYGAGLGRNIAFKILKR